MTGSTPPVQGEHGDKTVVKVDQVWAALRARSPIGDPRPYRSSTRVIAAVAVGRRPALQIDFRRVLGSVRAPRVMTARARGQGDASRADPEVAVIKDDSGRPTASTRPAGRSCAKPGFAPPAPRAAGTTTLVQLQSKASLSLCARPRREAQTISARTPCARSDGAKAAGQPFEKCKTIGMSSWCAAPSTKCPSWHAEDRAAPTAETWSAGQDAR